MRQEHFCLYKLFKKSPKITLSDQEIADFYATSVEVVRGWIEEVIQNGMIFKDPNDSNYYLSSIGLDRLHCLKRKEEGW